MLDRSRVDLLALETHLGILILGGLASGVLVRSGGFYKLSLWLSFFVSF